MSRYAQGTTVAKGRTLQHVERTVMRFGASSFGQATEQFPDGSCRAGVLFSRNGITYQVTMDLPSPGEREFTHTPAKGIKRIPEEALALWEQRNMEKWRALAAYVKALLVAVEEGIVSFEQAMLPHMLGAGGKTVAEELVPKVILASERGEWPVLSLIGMSTKELPAPADEGR